MKKILSSVLAVLIFVSVSNAAGFDISRLGVSVKAGSFGKSSNIGDIMLKDAQEWFKTASGVMIGYSVLDIQEIQFSDLLGIDVFYDHKVADRQYVGLKIGYANVTPYADTREQWGGPSWPINYFKEEARSTGYAIPINAYYKYETSEKFNVSGGLGIAIISNKFEVIQIDGYTSFSGVTTITNRDIETKNKTIVSPSINIGAEWRISKWIGIAADLGYGLGGKVDVSAMFPGSSDGLSVDYNGARFYLGINLYPFSWASK